MNVSGSNYVINSKRIFIENLISDDQLQRALDFAFDMIYGAGYHRSSRTGGRTIRSKGEKFCNTFQGKLAEIILHDLFLSATIEVKELDFGIYGVGEWDDCDLIANGKRVNIKSASSFSNLLLLETEDWDLKGRYLPDLATHKETMFDYFALVRFKPDVKRIMSDACYFNVNTSIAKAVLEELLFNRKWYYDVGGCIDNACLMKMISLKYIIPKGAYLNGKIKMDASNYYIQAGNMAKIDALINKLM